MSMTEPLTSVQCVEERDAHHESVGCKLHQAHLSLAVVVAMSRLIALVCAGATRLYTGFPATRGESADSAELDSKG